MSDGQSARGPDREFEAIEAAVLETARGRWFLAEFARRNRTADTLALLDAIRRLERAIPDRPSLDLQGVRAGLDALGEALRRLRAEAEAPCPATNGRPPHPADVFDRMPRQIEAALSEIVAAAEAVQETAWTLRERGADPARCDSLDRNASAIYAACGRQDLVARRLAGMMSALRLVEERADRLLLLAGPPHPSALSVPPRRTEPDIRDDDLEFVVVDDDREPASAGPDRPAASDRRTAEERGPVSGPTPEPSAGLDAIDALGTAEKLRLFT